MRKILTIRSIIVTIYFCLCLFLLLLPVIAYAEESEFSFGLKKVEKGDTLWKMFGSHWKTVSKINRISPERIKKGMDLKVPYDWELAKKYAPVPRELPGHSHNKKLIFINISAQAFGAYENGLLITWGPISSSSERIECGLASKKKYKCVTPRGKFFISEKDVDHISKKYPQPNGGSPMKYAMKFYGNYWIHAGILPGYPDSHGCIRIFHDDAKWLFSWADKKTL
ncbi:MAG: hypothetical protein COU71_00080, partial [Parcubacteria group bacterium CG10_big_fil_rev_8_21_14_0_10_38_31]